MSIIRTLARPAAATSAALLFGALAACGDSSAADGEQDFTLEYQGTPSTVQFPELAESLGYFENVELKWTSDTTSGPTSIQNTATGESDVGSAFNGAIVKLVAAGAPLTAVVDSYGADEETFNGFYTLEDSGITEGKDLIGKKVGMNTLGAHAEFVVREWLAQEGLSNAEIETVELTVVPPINTEQALHNGDIDVGALSGVFRDSALERGGLTELFTDNTLYEEFSYGTYVFRNDFIEKNPDAVEDFVQGTARAIRWTQVTPREEVVAKYKEIITERQRAGEDPELADYWKSTGIPASGGVIDERELQIWVDWLTRNGELDDGEIEVEKLYTNEYNPYANGTFEPDADAEGQ